MPAQPNEYSILLVGALNQQQVNNRTHKQNEWITEFSIDPGRRYDRIVRHQYQLNNNDEKINDHTRVSCFVQRTNAYLIAAATWSTPARYGNKQLRVICDLTDLDQFTQLINNYQSYSL